MERPLADKKKDSTGFFRNWDELLRNKATAEDTPSAAVPQR